ncbi:MAG: hypothetical protein WBD24_06330 [Candidatus Omnitrophota bacterium]
MPDTFAITIILIVITTFAGAFIRGRSKDRCLKYFSGSSVTLERKDGKTVWGRLKVENSGLDLVYDSAYLDKEDDQIETSYILYKSEFGDIQTIIRFVDSLDPGLLKRRTRDLERTCKPGWHLSLNRRIRNVFGTIRDSLLEATNLLMGRAKSFVPAGKILQGQDKYTSSLQQQLVASVGTSYEPILERYIGKKVVLAMIYGEKKTELAGILKDYTTEFITLLDAAYRTGSGEKSGKADILIPRSIGLVRHSGE